MLQHLIKRYTSTETVSQWRNKYSFKKSSTSPTGNISQSKPRGKQPSTGKRQEGVPTAHTNHLTFVCCFVIGCSPVRRDPLWWTSFLHTNSVVWDEKKQYTKFNWKWQLYYWKSLWQIQNKTRKKKTKTLETEPGITLNTEGRNTA